MIITHQGVDSFKVSFGDTTIAINPISKDSKIKSSKFGADITLISSNDPEHNGADNTSRGEKESFVISGPGEYEVSGIFIKGFLSKTMYGGKENVNTIYTITMEGMNLCFLGAFSEDSIPQTAKKATEDVDILFVPIGGNGVLDPAQAQKIAVQFEPRIIIPTHFEGVGEDNCLKKFLKEIGNESVKPTDKLTIKKKDIENMEGEVVILTSEV
jgi:L-ascorbate metabolism protein UlaG (beta-lactamase superfamily)